MIQHLKEERLGMGCTFDRDYHLSTIWILEDVTDFLGSPFKFLYFFLINYFDSEIIVFF